MAKKSINTKIISFFIVFALMIGIMGIVFYTKPTEKLTSASSNPPYDKHSREPSTVLMVQGSPNSQCDTRKQLTHADLLALPQQEFTTTHEWSDKPQQFKGPYLTDVIALSCANASKLNLRALNDYRIDVDLNVIRPLNPILAHTIDGKRASIKEKGPLWLMVDIDNLASPPPGLAGLLIWQLSDIIIMKTDNS